MFDAKVVEGRDGYLFMADDNNQVLAQHSGRLRLAADQLEGWRRVLEGRSDALAKRGCEHVVLIAPNNHSVYPEKLPEDIASAPERPVHQLLGHLADHASPVHIIYPLAELVAAKPEHQVCSQVDSHWTDYGAFLAYSRLVEYARTLVPTRIVEREDVMFVDVDVEGDLGEKLNPPRRVTQGIARMRNRMARPVYDNCVEGTGALAVTRCDVAPDATCLLVGDSYCYFLLPYLSESWRRLVLAHSPNLDPAVVEAVAPRLAVTMIAERFLIQVPDEGGGRRLVERERRKRDAGRIRPPLLYWLWPSMLSAGPVEVMRVRLLREGRMREAALICLIAYAGLRPPEAMALRWSDVGSDSIRVAPLPLRREQGAAAREVPLWSPLAEDLAAWREESAGGERQRVFAAPGRPSAGNLAEWRSQDYPSVAIAAGLDLALSLLRNVFCVLLIEEGRSVDEVAVLVDGDPEELAETFRGLVTDVRRTGERSAEQLISRARAAAVA